MALLFLFDTIESRMETYFTTQKKLCYALGALRNLSQFEIAHGIASVSPTTQIYNVRDSA